MLLKLLLLVTKVFTKLLDNFVNVLLGLVYLGLGHFFPNDKLLGTDLAVRRIHAPWVWLHIPKLAIALEGNGLGDAEAFNRQRSTAHVVIEPAGDVDCRPFDFESRF